MANLTKPQNTTALVLYRLLSSPISERDMYLNGFRARLSNLRKLGLDISYKEMSFINQFGHSSSYRVHYLTDIQKKLGRELYKLINKPKK